MADVWDYASKAIECKVSKEKIGENENLIVVVRANIDGPYFYDRLAVLYLKEKDYQKAIDVCKKWAISKYGKDPRRQTRSRKILERLEKLKKNIDSALMKTNPNNQDPIEKR